MQGFLKIHSICSTPKSNKPKRILSKMEIWDHYILVVLKYFMSMGFPLLNSVPPLFSNF